MVGKEEHKSQAEVQHIVVAVAVVLVVAQGRLVFLPTSRYSSRSPSAK